jgi:hypothetical protein
MRNTSSGDQAVSGTEFIEFVHDYSSAFRPGNVQEMAQFFTFPCCMIANGRRLNIGSPGELLAMFSGALEALASKGFSHSEVREIHAHSLAEDTAIVSASYDRLRADGSLLETLAATYNLWRGEGRRWKIVLITLHDANNLLRNH